jgi:phage terminase large subunit-like protein
MTETMIDVLLKRPHAKQREFIEHPAKRKIIRAGRRSGKTTGVGIFSVEKFLAGKRILYAVPTTEQLNRFWTEVTRALYNPIEAGVYYQNKTEHIIELPGTEQRIKAKTAWNADSLRGDYADILVMDEYQLMNEDTWGIVGAPMMLDTNGDAIFIYTPPSLHSRSVTKANDPQHAAKLFRKYQNDTSGRWKTFNFTSMDNPHISQEALEDITRDMTDLAYRMEILAQDVEQSPGALWNRDMIESSRVTSMPELDRIIVGVDPSATSTGDEAGVITCGRKGENYFTLADDSIQGSPLTWAKAAVTAYHRHKANYIAAESNNGGEMVSTTIHQVDANVPVKLVHASRGKATRAEPVSAIAEKGHDHHVGNFTALEDELCLWVPGDPSPNRLDAKVWAMTELMAGGIKITPKATVTNWTR